MGNHWSDDGPERIYLQPALDADEEGRTWCRDAIHTPDELRCPDTEPTDTPYIREDLHLSALAEKEREVERLREAGLEFYKATSALLDWMNGNDMSADHHASKPDDFGRLNDALEAFSAVIVPLPTPEQNP